VCVCSPSDEGSTTKTAATTRSPVSPAVAAGNNMNFKRGIAYRTTISGSTVKDPRSAAVPTRTATFAVPDNDVSSVSHGSGGGSGGRGLSFFDKLTSKFSRRYVLFQDIHFLCFFLSQNLVIYITNCVVWP